MHRITTVAAARFLAEPRGHFLVMASAHQPRTVSAVAEDLGWPLLSAWRLVRRAVALGLIAERGQVARRGRALRLYQAAASVFEIPDELMPRLPGEILAAELRERLRAGIAWQGRCHRIIAGADGEPQMIPVAAEAGAPVPFEAWRIIRLDPAGARALEAELAALLDRHEARQHPAGRPFLVHAAMVLRGGQGGTR